jgi:hypothetical protein
VGAARGALRGRGAGVRPGEWQGGGVRVPESGEVDGGEKGGGGCVVEASIASRDTFGNVGLSLVVRNTLCMRHSVKRCASIAAVVLNRVCTRQHVMGCGLLFLSPLLMPSFVCSTESSARLAAIHTDSACLMSGVLAAHHHPGRPP